MTLNGWIRLLVSVVVGALSVACSKKDEATQDTRYEVVHTAQVVKGIDEYLGKGYKGYQYYANPESCTVALFDLTNHQHVDIQKAPSYKGRFASGENKSQFYDQFSAGVSTAGSYDGFSGEITANFSSSALRNRNNSFFTSHIAQTYYRLTVLDSAPLKASVQQDLATLEPTALFDRYGTHFLKSIYIGGRVSFSSYVDRAATSKQFDVKTSAQAAYAKIVEGKASTHSGQSTDIEQIAQHKKITVMGGDPAKAAGITDGQGEPAAAYAAWSESVPQFMSIADFADGGLTPIYELVSDPARRAQLEQAWQTYMAAHTDEVLKEGEPAVVNKTDPIKLYSEDGRFVGKAPYEATSSYYYPTVSDKAVTLQLAGAKGPLESGHNVKIKTTETFKDSITGKWSKRVYLGAFQLKHWLYYWAPSGSKTNWLIERVVPASEASIRFGDSVLIRNEYFKDQYLAPSSDGYLTTIKTPYRWVIQQP